MKKFASKISGIINMTNKTSLYAKSKEVENKIHNITGFITTTECYRFKKIIIIAKMKHASKDSVSKNSADFALDSACENREKILKIQTFLVDNLGYSGRRQCLSLHAVNRKKYVLVLGER